MLRHPPYILNTLATLSGVAQVLWYEAIVGLSESTQGVSTRLTHRVAYSSSPANFPITGIVHFAPGRCFFLYRYTDCSRTSRVTTSTRIEVVQLVSENRAARFDGAKLASPFPANDPRPPLLLSPLPPPPKTENENEDPALAWGGWTCADEWWCTAAAAMTATCRFLRAFWGVYDFLLFDNSRAFLTPPPSRARSTQRMCVFLRR